MTTRCPICHARRARRLCPGLSASRWAGQDTGDQICAPCCGTEREVTIDCPSTCPYLIAARRYEQEQAAQGAGREVPEPAFPDVRIEPGFLDEQQPLLARLALAIVRFAQENPRLADPDVLTALEHLAQTHQTLASGLYYEKPPDAVWARELYTALAAASAAHRQEHQQRAGVSVRPGDILKVLVFLVRLGRARSNSRPLSRAFLDFLRAQLPAEAAQSRAESRLIVPGT